MAIFTWRGAVWAPVEAINNKSYGKRGERGNEQLEDELKGVDLGLQMVFRTNCNHSKVEELVRAFKSLEVQ